MNSIDWFAKWATYSPERIALREVETDRQVSYAELNRMAEQMADYLHAGLNMVKGDRIAFIGSFSINLIALFGACQKTGLILVPLNTRLTRRELSYQYKDSNPKLFISDEAHFEVAHDISESSQRFDGFFQAAKRNQTSRAIEEVSDDDPIFILYTSGTTGFPKGALYTHKMMFWNSINTALRLNLNASDLTVNCMPSFHTGGWNVLITPLLHHGGEIWLMRNFDGQIALEQIQKSKCTVFMAVPTMLAMMKDAMDSQAFDLACVRYFIIGGEALPIPTIEYWESKNIPIRQGYGLTEVGPNVTSLHQTDSLKKRGSIGFPNFYIDWKLITQENKVAKANQVGELWLSGKTVTPGYWNNTKATKEAIEDGWFKTGDLLYFDNEGYLYVAGRKKEMYISGGENVYPREVEIVLQRYQKINEAAVIGVKHEKWGETGAAFIAVNETCNELEIRDYCAKNLAKYKLPKYFFFLNDLPKNATGKIDKQRLIQIYNHSKKQPL